MSYLTDAEIPLYTSLPGVTPLDVANASLMIDSYKMMSFKPKTYTEKVQLKRKRSKFGDEYKGKLTHIPRCEIVEVYANVRSYMGITKQTYDPSTSLEFDSDILWYFTFYPQLSSSVNPFPTMPPDYLYVTYRAGYDVIPDSLKIACGTLAQNLRQNGGFQRWTDRSDFDMKITLANNEGIMTSEIKRMVDLVQLT